MAAFKRLILLFSECLLHVACDRGLCALEMDFIAGTSYFSRLPLTRLNSLMMFPRARLP